MSVLPIAFASYGRHGAIATTEAELNLPTVRACAPNRRPQEIYSALRGQMREDAARADCDREAPGHPIYVHVHGSDDPGPARQGKLEIQTAAVPSVGTDAAARLDA